MPADSDAWRVTTDRSSIRQWADERDAVPVHEETAGGERRIDVVDVDALGAAAERMDDDAERTSVGAEQADEDAAETDADTAGPDADATGPDAYAAGTGADADRITWDQFFELFEAEGLAFRYRPDEEGETDWELVDRTSAEETTADATAQRDDVASDPIVASDTGEGEPVIDDRVESATQADAATGDRRDEREDDPGNLSPKRTGETDDPESPTAESARGAEAAPIVLEELYEDPGGFDSDPSEEYVVLRNDGDERLELTGWTVENGLERSYEFPDGFVLDPGQEVTLRSGTGEDTATELHWGSEKPVWGQQGGTVVVRSATGDRVLREAYRDG